MKLKRRYFVIIFLLIFIAGCKKEVSPVSGGQGLDISFVEDEPPATVLDSGNELFDVSLMLRNDGEYDIGKGGIIVTLNGLSKDAFSLTSLSKKSDFILNGKKTFKDRIEEGDSDEIRFENLKYVNDLVESDFIANFRADVCYEYGTNAIASLCLKKNVVKRKSGDICSIINEDLDVRNSEAPVIIKGMKQTRSGSNEVKFTFDIEKTGGGQIFAPNSFSDVCGENKDMEDKVGVKVSTASNLNIKCDRLNDEDEGIIRLVAGTKSVSCRIDTSSLQDSAYEERVRILLRYVYKDFKDNTITIVNEDFE